MKRTYACSPKGDFSQVSLFRSQSEKRNTDKTASTMLPQVKRRLNTALRTS
jgi:hypothetical protein